MRGSLCSGTPRGGWEENRRLFERHPSQPHLPCADMGARGVDGESPSGVNRQDSSQTPSGSLGHPGINTACRAVSQLSDLASLANLLLAGSIRSDAAEMMLRACKVLDNHGRAGNNRACVRSLHTVT